MAATRSAGGGHDAITASEARLLSLKRQPVRTASPTVREAARLEERHGGRSRMVAHAALWTVVAGIVAAGVLFIDRGRAPGGEVTSDAPLPDITVGSGRLVLPLARGENMLRVTVTAAQGANWFWCLEADGGIGEEQHVCGSAREFSYAGGQSVSERTVRLDGASAHDGRHFVQVFCESDCRWSAEVVR